MRAGSFSAVAALMLAMACGSGGGEGDPSSGGAAGNSGTGSGAGAGTGGSGGGGGTAGNGGTGDAGPDGSGAAASDAGDAATSDAGDAAPAQSAPVLSTAKVQVVGRYGTDVRFEIQGSDNDADAVGITVTFKDQNGRPEPVFDSDFDGFPDAATGRVLFDAPVSSATFNVSATLVGGARDWLTTATVSVLDKRQQSSAALDILVDQQEVRHLDETCDPTNRTDRCDPGISCAATTKKCKAGVAPTLDKVAYLRDVGGPVLLAAGKDPDDDLETLQLRFYKPVSGGEAPVVVDLDNDGNPDSDRFEIDLDRVSVSGDYFVRNQSAEGFDLEVPRIKVTALDSVGQASREVTANIQTRTLVGKNGACDARGFSNGCTSDFVCMPGLPVIVGRCEALVDARRAQCSAAAPLGAAAANWRTSGRIDGASLWEPPAGCVPGDAKGRPESVVALKLAAPATKLVISTANPETNFDTAVYLLPGACPDSTVQPLACNDDAAGRAHGFASKLELTNVPAGDYLIVVESIPVKGGSFGLSVTVE